MSRNKTNIHQKDEESDSYDDEPIIRKKTKLNAEAQHKKTDDKHGDKKGGASDKRGSSNLPPRKETRSSHNDRKTDQSLPKNKNTKREPSPEKKINSRADKKRGNLKGSQDKTGSKKANPPSSSKDRNNKEKKSEKNEKEEKPKSVQAKINEGPKKKEVKNKKQEKAKGKDLRSQAKFDMIMEAAKHEKRQKAKEQSEKERQLAEFTKKYPQYINRGKFKFPIDDKLFQVYDILLDEHIPKIEKPKPKMGFVPPKQLGDILQIWDFFNSFPELFQIEDIEKEEIYASLAYEGDEYLNLVNDMHQGVLSLYIIEFIKKFRFETYKDETEHPFLVLIKHYVGNATHHGDELALIWTEFARKIAYLTPYGDFLTESIQRYFEILAEKTCLLYNKLPYKAKIKIMLSLIEGVYETDVFRDFLQSKVEATGLLVKERNDLQTELKQDEQEHQNLKNKINQLKKGMKKAEPIKAYPSRLGSLRKPRAQDAPNKQEDVQKYVDDLVVLEDLMEGKQERLDDINSELVLTLQTATLIGTDANKSEYWVFQNESDKVYVRNPNIVEAEEEWYFYNTRAEIDHLQQTLNTKGIKEKELHDNLEELTLEGRLFFDEDDVSSDEEEEEKKNNGKPTQKGRKKAKDPIQEEKEEKEEEEKIVHNHKQQSMEVEKKNEDKMEEEEEEEDDYVVKKKEHKADGEENGETDQNKMEEETKDENEADKEREREAQIELEKEKLEKEKLEQEEKEKQKEMEIELEKQRELEKEQEKERVRLLEKQRRKEERERRRKKREMDDEFGMNFDYWFQKVIEYQTPFEEPEIAPTEPESTQPGQKPAQLPIGQAQPLFTFRKRKPEELNFESIKNLILKTETALTDYLERWEARWAHPQIRQELMGKIKEAKDIEDLRPVLLKLNELFQYSETPRRRRGRPYRPKEEGRENEENEEDKEEEEEGGLEDDEDDEKDWGSKRSDGEGGDLDEEEKSKATAEKHRDEMEEEKEESKEEKEGRAQDEQQHNDRDSSKPHREDSSTNALSKLGPNPNEQVKKIPLKFWGTYSARIKKCWATFIAEADNLTALYFAIIFLCEPLNNYVEKKSEQYFTLYKTGKEYMAAKRRMREEALEKKAEASQTQEPTFVPQKTVEQTNIESLDRFRHPRRAAAMAAIHNPRYVDETASQGKSSPESDSMVGRLRKRSRRPPRYTEIQYPTKPKIDERVARMKQREQLEDLSNRRRSTRIINQIKKRYDNLNEEQWYTECKVCGKGEGEMIACSMCFDSFHRDCVGLDTATRQDSWICEPCLQKIASQRQTRSSTRRLQI